MTGVTGSTGPIGLIGPTGVTGIAGPTGTNFSVSTTSVNSTFYPTFVNTTSGILSQLNTDTSLTFNPNTNQLTTSGPTILANIAEGRYIEIDANTANTSFIDFHSKDGAGTADYDGRILCEGGDLSTTGQGAMLYEALSHTFKSNAITTFGINSSGNITLKTSGTAPTSGQLGYVQTVTNISGISINASDTVVNIASITLSSGTWSVIANVRIANTAGFTTISAYEVGFSDSINLGNNGNYPYTVFTSGRANVTIEFGKGFTYPIIIIPTFFTLTTTTTIYINGKILVADGSTGTGNKFQDIYIQAVRIA
jgi:hypothetical protein